MVHILLNVFGALLFLFVPGLRELPPAIARWLAGHIERYDHAPAWLAGYVGSLFFGVPLLVIGLLEWLC